MAFVKAWTCRMLCEIHFHWKVSLGSTRVCGTCLVYLLFQNSVILHFQFGSRWKRTKTATSIRSGRYKPSLISHYASHSFICPKTYNKMKYRLQAHLHSDPTKLDSYALEEGSLFTMMRTICNPLKAKPVNKDRFISKLRPQTW